MPLNYAGRVQIDFCGVQVTVVVTTVKNAERWRYDQVGLRRASLWTSSSKRLPET